MSLKTNWFIKGRRAQSVEDYETWNEGGVVPTLNVMDNTGDTRATVLIFYGNRVDDIRIQGDVINTLQARMGTGGGNMPIDFYESGPGFIKQTEISGVLRAEGENRQSRPTHTIQTSATVRRLTPTECERLQGFPDGWTEDQADTHRYKQMGNAVAVPVVSWLIKRLMEA